MRIRILGIVFSFGFLQLLALKEKYIEANLVLV